MELSDDEVIKNIGHKLREIRKQKKMTQFELAKAAGIYRDHLGRIERAETNVSIVILYHLAYCLKIKIEDLFDD